jgi:hypothetical protein
MTPPATAASRSLARTAPGGRRAVVRHPRRISGPTRPTGSARVATAVAVAAPGVALPRQRPARPASKPRRAPARKSPRGSAHESPGIALRTVGVFEAVSASALLDRLIRGRIWIGLLAFSLIGIVAMQLVVLKLNTGIGGTLTREATLQRENAQLGIEDSMYSAESRVAPLAAAAGMTLAPAGTVHFVQAAPADVARAASALSAPIQASAGSQAGATESTATTESAASESPALESSASESSASESSAANDSTGTAAAAGTNQASSAGSSSTEAPSAAAGSGTSSGESETSSAAGATGAATTTATGGSTEPSSSGAGG